MRVLNLLAATILLRPYVFAFFTCYLFLAISRMGWRRTLLFTIVAYSIAWLSEWSSAVLGTGIPFGVYRYLPVTVDKELWVAGVPFMDSLSFTFLSYVSWELAIGLRMAWRREGMRVRPWLSVSILAAFLMVCLDLIIDPVALRGDRWFLGKLYYYPNGGLYFGVTIANFIGWFIVCLLILRVYIFLEAILFHANPGYARTIGLSFHPPSLIVPAMLYFAVYAFNLVIAFSIGERMLGLVGLLILLPLAAVVVIAVLKTRTLYGRFAS
jgi:putative membrane protein